MANLMKTTDSRLPLVFNVDQRVGQGCPNLPEDVALVSYLMRLAAKGAGPKTKPIFLNTAVTTTCTPALVQSIKEVQIAHRMEPDGRVSPATANGCYSKGVYLVFHFNGWVRRDYPDLWPRIDRIADAPTPAAVISLVQRAMLGIG